MSDKYELYEVSKIDSYIDSIDTLEQNKIDLESEISRLEAEKTKWHSAFNVVNKDLNDQLFYKSELIKENKKLIEGIKDISEDLNFRGNTDYAQEKIAELLATKGDIDNE